MRRPRLSAPARRVVALMAALMAALTTSCSDRSGRVVHVYAAASLRQACEEFERDWGREHADVRLVFNFGGSNVLAQQILAGQRADVYLTADVEQAAPLRAAELVEREAPQPWLSNQLVVVVPAARLDLRLDSPAALADERVRRLSIGNPDSVPAGRYAKVWLESQGLWTVLEGRVAPAVDVRAALAAVESGACEAGIVYSTDAEITDRVRVVLRVPAKDGPKIEYALVQLRGPGDPRDATAVFDALRSADELLTRLGFLVGPGR